MTRIRHPTSFTVHLLLLLGHELLCMAASASRGGGGRFKKTRGSQRTSNDGPPIGNDSMEPNGSERHLRNLPEGHLYYGGSKKVCPKAYFPQAPEIRSYNGKLVYNMQVYETTNEIAGVLFTHRSYEGRLSGPTMRLSAGDHMIVNIHNQLPSPNFPPLDPDNFNIPHGFQTMNLHTHGFRVKPSEDDVFVKIQPGSSYTYNYNLPCDHPAGTFWYHPHHHGATAMHLFSGLSGVIIIEGGYKNGDLNSVKAIKDAEEIVFNINELNLQGYNSGLGGYGPFVVPNYTVPGPRPFAAEDSIWIVNGYYQPVMKTVPGQVVRLRILNSSARNQLLLTIQDSYNQTIKMHLLSLDGLTIPKVRSVHNVTLFSAQRSELLVKFPKEGTYRILGELASMADFEDPVLATVNVWGKPCDMELYNDYLPTPQDLPDIEPYEVTESRNLTYAIGFPGPRFTMDGKLYDPNRIDQYIEVGDVIDWTLLNPSFQEHPHHIHIHPFQVYQTSNDMLHGLPFPPPGHPDHQKVWLDTVPIPSNDGWVKARQRFPDNPGDYVIHCHILVHEDVGMMQNVRLTEPRRGYIPPLYKPAFPCPSYEEPSYEWPSPPYHGREHPYLGKWGKSSGNEKKKHGRGKA